MRFEIPTRTFRWPESDFLGDCLISLVQDRRCRRLIVDFGQVEFVTATALGKLVAVRKVLLSRGTNMVLRNLHPLVYDVFRVTRLAALFDVPVPTVERLLRC